MSLADDILRSLRTAETFTGSQTFTFQGIDYPCTVSTETRGNTYEIGGKLEEVQRSLFVRAEVLVDGIFPVDRPHSGVVIQQGGESFRVLSVRYDPMTAFYRLELSSAKK